MKMIKILVVAIISFLPFSIIGQTQLDSLAQLVATLLRPPVINEMNIYQAFASTTTYVAAIVTMILVYVSQWIPGLKAVLAKIPSGYFRAIIVGGGALWVVIANGKIYGSQAVIAFLLSNVLWEILKNILPSSPLKTLKTAQTESNVSD